jgi:hypothetical protein
MTVKARSLLAVYPIGLSDPPRILLLIGRAS